MSEVLSLSSPGSETRCDSIHHLSLEEGYRTLPPSSPISTSPPTPSSPATLTAVDSPTLTNTPLTPTPTDPAAPPRPTRTDLKAARERLQTEYEYRLSTYTHFLSFGHPLPLALLHTSHRARVFAWLDCATINGGSYVWSTLMTLLIVASFVCILLQSLPQYRVPSASGDVGNEVMDDIQLAVLIVFTAQLVVRVLTVSAYVGLQRQRAGQPAVSVAYTLLIFFTRPFNLIDLAGIVPLWFDVAGLISDSFSVVLILRIIRVLLLSRLLSGKIARALVMFSSVIRRSTDVLELMLVYLAVGMVIFGPLIFYAEQGSYDDESGQFLRPTVTGDVDGTREVSPFSSIPQCVSVIHSHTSVTLSRACLTRIIHSMTADDSHPHIPPCVQFYWVVVTMSTLGYGDLVPTTGGGKVVTSLCVVCGVVMVAMPISIIGTTFTKEYDEERAKLRLYAEEARDLRLAELAATQLHAASTASLDLAVKSRSLREQSSQRSARAPRRVLNRMRSMSTEMFEALHSQLKIGPSDDSAHPPRHQPLEQMTAEQRAAAALLAQMSSEEAKVAVMLSAAARDDAERVLSLLQSGVSPSACDYDKRSGLHVAASEGSLAVVNCLIDRGADVNCVDRFGHTPLDDAVKAGNADVIDALRLTGAQHSETFRRAAPMSPEAALASQLLVEAASEEARVALLLFAASRDDVDRCRMLLDSGVLPSAMDYDQRSALHVAASDAAAAVVRLLIDRRADVNARDRWGHTPLDDAASIGAREVTEALTRASAIHSEEFLRKAAAAALPLTTAHPHPQVAPVASPRSLSVIAEDDSSERLEAIEMEEKVSDLPRWEL